MKKTTMLLANGNVAEMKELDISDIDNSVEDESLKDKISVTCDILKKIGYTEVTFFKVIHESMKNEIFCLRTKYLIMNFQNLDLDSFTLPYIQIFFHMNVRSSHSALLMLSLFEKDVITKGENENTLVAVDDYYESKENGVIHIGIENIVKELKREKLKADIELKNDLLDEMLETLKPDNMIEC